MLQRHGWRLCAHPQLLGQMEKLTASIERAKAADPEGWRRKTDAKVFTAVQALVMDRIPRDPMSPAFRQGNTLGTAHRHWLRARFGGNRFRLFFRADSAARVIVFAWVNDRDTLRKAGASSDPYAVFAGMLAKGNPPDSWEELLTIATDTAAETRFATLADEPG